MTSATPQLAEEWSNAFELYYRLHNKPIGDYLAFINGSFSMNATPERRQNAFLIIKGLLALTVYLDIKQTASVSPSE